MDIRKFRRRVPRNHSNDNLELLIDENLFNADVVNVSETGICVESNTPLSFQIMLKKNDGIKKFQARLVWCKTDQNGKVSYGLCLEEDEQELRDLE